MKIVRHTMTRDDFDNAVEAIYTATNSPFVTGGCDCGLSYKECQDLALAMLRALLDGGTGGTGNTSLAVAAVLVTAVEVDDIAHTIKVERKATEAERRERAQAAWVAFQAQTKVMRKAFGLQPKEKTAEQDAP